MGTWRRLCARSGARHGGRRSTALRARPRGQKGTGGSWRGGRRRRCTARLAFASALPPFVLVSTSLAHCMYLQQQSLSLVVMARYTLIVFHTTRASPTLDRRRDSLAGRRLRQPGHDSGQGSGPQSPALSRTLTQATTAAPHCSLSGRRRRLGVLNLLHLDLLAHELIHVDHYALLLHIHKDE